MHGRHPQVSQPTFIKQNLAALSFLNLSAIAPIAINAIKNK